jgi:hypothetical protein
MQSVAFACIFLAFLLQEWAAMTAGIPPFPDGSTRAAVSDCARLRRDRDQEYWMPLSRT